MAIWTMLHAKCKAPVSLFVCRFKVFCWKFLEAIFRTGIFPWLVGKLIPTA